MSVITKNKKVGKEQTIKEVVQYYKLPVNICFSSDQHIIVVGTQKSTNHFPVLTLVEEFDEIYMLANSLTEGRIYLNVVRIPLNLSKLRLAEVTGIRRQPTEVWTYFIKELSTIVLESVEFDTTYGNKDIAIFNEIPTGTEGSYTYLQPRKYTPFYDTLTFEPCESSCLHKCQCLEYVSDEFSRHKSNDLDSGQRAAVERKLPSTTGRNKPLPFLPKCTDIASAEKSYMDTEKKRPPAPPKPKVEGPKCDLKSEIIEILIWKDERGVGITLACRKSTKQVFLQITSIIPGGQADQDGRLKTGDILVRVNDKFVLGYTLLEVSSLFESIELGELMKLEVCRGTTLMTDPSDLNTPNVTEKTNAINDFDCQQSNDHDYTTARSARKTISGTTYQSSGTDTQAVRCSRTKDEESSTSNKNYVTTKIDVGSLSIKELGYYLKELRLSKWVPMFENERIDGVILLDLDVDIFMNEFGLSNIEARRLWKFAQDGHVPR